MGSIENFNNFIDKWNVLTRPTDCFAKFFGKHPALYKAALIVNHLFRAAMMVGFMFIPGIPKVPGMVICFTASLFYRLTVEKNCAYKFALPAFAGALAVMLAIPAITNMINKIAFTSAGRGVLSCVSLIPIPLYIAYLLLTVSHEVDENFKRQLDNKKCCETVNS